MSRDDPPIEEPRARRDRLYAEAVEALGPALAASPVQSSETPNTHAISNRTFTSPCGAALPEPPAPLRRRARPFPRR